MKLEIKHIAILKGTKDIKFIYNDVIENNQLPIGIITDPNNQIFKNLVEKHEVFKNNLNRLIEVTPFYKLYEA